MLIIKNKKDSNQKPAPPPTPLKLRTQGEKNMVTDGPLSHSIQKYGSVDYFECFLRQILRMLGKFLLKLVNEI